jgi:metallo-beta-lactamase family protein
VHEGGKGTLPRLEFHGAAGAVTGSHHLLDTGRTRLGIDAGLVQGSREMEWLNWQGFGHDIRRMDALVLTHAHIDHCGRVPVLAKDGYRGPVFSTAATLDLAGLMLHDSARLMEEEALHDSHHPEQGEEGRLRGGGVAVRSEPLFTERDVEDALGLFRPQDYGRPFSPAPDIQVRFRDSGHILGSAMVELDISGRVGIFSGDLGRPGSPLLRDPERIAEADWLVMESTYGDREHADKADRGRRLFSIIRETIDRGGNVVIPAFTVGRTQDILYELNTYAEKGQLPLIATFVDSPMAISAGEIYRRHPECFDVETLAMLARGDDPLSFPGLRLARTKEESIKINALREPHIVIAGNGMCTGGRVRHHLAQNLGREESTILFVGYQAEGTLGRQLRDGSKMVRMFGKPFDVRAHIEVIDAYSAHADRSEILDWLEGFKTFPRKIFLVHGEPQASASLASAIYQRFGIEPTVPRSGETLELD